MSIESSLKDGRKLFIDRAEPVDAMEIVAYINRVSAESDNLTFGAGEFGMSVAEETEYIAGLEGGKFNFMLKGIVDGRIVSTCNVVRPKRPRVSHTGVFALSVARSHWGLGIGKRMCEAMLDWARKVGVTKVNLEVRADHAVAIRLYESLGFRHEGLITQALKIGARYFDNRSMGIGLD